MGNIIWLKTSIGESIGFYIKGEFFYIDKTYGDYKLTNISGDLVAYRDKDKPNDTAVSWCSMTEWLKKCGLPC